MESSQPLRNSGARWPLAVTLALGTPLAVAAPDLHAQASGAVLGGVVLDDVTMEPIGAATVTIIGTGMSAVTDERGTFVFSEPPVGRTSVRVVAADRVSVVQEIELQAESVTHVQFFLPAIDAVVSELLVRGPAESTGTIKVPLSAVDILARKVPGAFGALPMPGDTDQPVILRGLGTFGDNVEPVLLGRRGAGSGVRGLRRPESDTRGGCGGDRGVARGSRCFLAPEWRRWRDPRPYENGACRAAELTPGSIRNVVRTRFAIRAHPGRGLAAGRSATGHPRRLSEHREPGVRRSNAAAATSPSELNRSRSRRSPNVTSPPRRGQRGGSLRP